MFCLFVKDESVKFYPVKFTKLMHHKVVPCFSLKCYLIPFFTIIVSLLGVNNQLIAQNFKPGINFQAIAKDYENNPANNRKIYILSMIEKGTANGSLVYKESHEAMTNELGVFSIAVGKGTHIAGAVDLNKIDWMSGPYFIHLKISIAPIAPAANWDFNKEWIDLGAVEFGVVPYALQALSATTTSIDTTALNKKLNISDTAALLFPYAFKTDLSITNNKLASKLNTADTATMLVPYKIVVKNQDSLFSKLNGALYTKDSSKYVTPFQLAQNSTDTSHISNRINYKLNIADTSTMLQNYARAAQINSSLNLKLNNADTSLMLSARIARDTTAISNRINLKENISNKAADLNNLSNYNDLNYPSVKAVKDYVDAGLIAGATDATTVNKGILKLAGDLTGTASWPLIAADVISTTKLQDASVTDAKLAAGINASKVGLGNLTNNAQLYNLNGLTAQVQSFATPGSAGLLPNWNSTGSSHTLNIPMASASAVTAGLISKLDYDHFNTAYSNRVDGITTIGSTGVATLSGNVLNIPNYTIVGLAGNVNPNTIFAGPVSGGVAAASFRTLASADIPNNAANTLGNAATASKLLNARYINNVLFDGAADITISSNTSNALSFSNDGLGVNAGSSFNGATAKTISYNSIGASPVSGSSSITSLGTILTGTWSATVIGANYGGAGNNNGILKANGSGLVSTAVAGTDYQSPLTFSSPFINNSNTISIPQANGTNSGYLLNTDWTSFNNKLDQSVRGVQNGVASLDQYGKIPTSQIPAISFSSGYVVSSQSAMLALSNAVVGSIAIRTDNSKNYVLSGLPASTLANWLELLMPVSVSSVNGHTESNITLTSSDIAEGTNLYHTDARSRAAISVTSPINYNASTGVISITAATTTASGYLSSSDWNTFNNKMGVFTSQTANSFYAGPASGVNASPSFRNIVVGDIPTLNQNTNGNAGTATKLAATKNINNVPFDGSLDISITAVAPNAITFDNSGSGVTSGNTFNGSVAKTISYNTIGAAPIAGATSITTVGVITAGTWNANVIDANHGGAGNITGLLKANGAGVVSAATAGTDFENPLSFSAPLTRITNTIAIPSATTSSNGYLTSSDWNLFNAKQATLVAGTGVAITGGNTIAIGQSVATTANPSFSAMTLSGLNVAGIVTNTAAGVLSTTATTGSGNIVRATSPVLTTPTLGDASATSIVTGTVTATSINVSGDVNAKRFKLTMPAAITAAASTTIDLSTGNVFTVNMGLNVTTLTLTNPVVGTYLIKFVQDATGTRDVTFPAAWKWAGGAAPNLTNTANKTDIVTLIYDGATYYSTIVQNF